MLRTHTPSCGIRLASTIAVCMTLCCLPPAVAWAATWGNYGVGTDHIGATNHTGVANWTGNRVWHGKGKWGVWYTNGNGSRIGDYVQNSLNPTTKDGGAMSAEAWCENVSDNSHKKWTCQAKK